jgi:WD40 repeat protein
MPLPHTCVLCLLPFLLDCLSFEATMSRCLYDCNVESSIRDDVEGNVAFSLSSSAKFVATVSSRGGVAIWDTATTKNLASWKPALFSKVPGRTYPGGEATGLCFDCTNDDVIYVCNTDGVFSLDWKAKAEPKAIIRFTRPFDNGPILSEMRSSGDGKWLAFIDVRGRVGLLDLRDKNEMMVFNHRLELPDDYSPCLTFLPDSSFLIIRQTDCLAKVSLKNAKKEAILVERSDDVKSIECLATGASGKLIVIATEEGTVRFWDFETGLKEHFAKINTRPGCIAISPNGQLLAIENDKGVLSVYSVKSKTEVAKMNGPKSGFTGVGFLADNSTLLGIGEFSGVRYWKLVEGKMVEQLK